MRHRTPFSLLSLTLGMCHLSQSQVQQNRSGRRKAPLRGAKDELDAPDARVRRNMPFSLLSAIPEPRRNERHDLVHTIRHARTYPLCGCGACAHVRWLGRAGFVRALHAPTSRLVSLVPSLLTLISPSMHSLPAICTASNTTASTNPLRISSNKRRATASHCIFKLSSVGAPS